MNARSSLPRLLDEATWYVALYGLAAHKAHRAEDLSDEMDEARDHALLLSFGAEVRIAGVAIPHELQMLEHRLFGREGGAEPLRRLEQDGPRPLRQALTLRKRKLPQEGSWRDRRWRRAKSPRYEPVEVDDRKDREFLAFLLGTVEPAALVLLAGTILASREEPPNVSEATIDVNAETLLRILPAMAAGEEDRLDPLTLVRSLVRRRTIDWRVQYNLACFYAQLGKRQRDSSDAFGEARARLTRAVREAPLITRQDLKAWAAIDPSLAPALVDWEGSAALLAPAAKPTAAVTARQTELARIHAIGGFASRLRELRIRSAHTLRVYTDTPEERAWLAKQLDVTQELVLHWAGLVSLIDEIDGIGTQEANLLDAAWIRSVADLRRADPDDLHRQLRETNAARRLVRSVPSRATVGAWIDQARSTAGPI